MNTWKSLKYSACEGWRILFGPICEERESITGGKEYLTELKIEEG